MSGFAVKVVIVLVAIALLVGIVARAFRRVKPAKPGQEVRRQRMPLLVMLIGAVLLAAGFVMALASFTSRYTHQLLPMRIASVVLFIVGLAVLVAYRNWYLEVDARQVRWRSILGREKHISYGEISGHRRVSRAGRPRLLVRSDSGARLSVDMKRYDVTRLVDAVERSSAAER